MAKKIKFDGVVTAVHYNPQGSVIWVRAYERRGPTFSDHILLDRQVFIERLKAGKIYYAGKRIPLLASTFELGVPIRLAQANAKDYLVSGDAPPANQDRLDGVPVI